MCLAHGKHSVDVCFHHYSFLPHPRMSLPLVSLNYWQYLTQKIISSFSNAFPFPWLLWHFTVLVSLAIFSFFLSFSFTCPLNVNISQVCLQLSVLPSNCCLCILINANIFSKSFRIITLKSSQILSFPSCPFSKPLQNIAISQILLIVPLLLPT